MINSLSRTKRAPFGGSIVSSSSLAASSASLCLHPSGRGGVRLFSLRRVLRLCCRRGVLQVLHLLLRLGRGEHGGIDRAPGWHCHCAGLHDLLRLLLLLLLLQEVLLVPRRRRA